ncbi:phasin family protein [Minwuia sp.]|uniref:phasin family protein n=1 Tax=Minwuia sp. TaxID=2493630 RepID=UPI003A8D1120
MNDAPKKTEIEKPAAEAAKTATDAAAKTAETTVKATAETAKAPAKAAAAATKPATRKTAAKPAAKKSAARKASAKPAARKTAKTAVKKAAAPARAAAKTATKTAAKAEPAIANAAGLTTEISDDFTRFVQSRVEDNLAFIDELQNVSGPADLIKAQQNYLDTAAKAYSEQFSSLNERYQDLFSVSFNPMVASFKDAGAQWRKMMGV